MRKIPTLFRRDERDRRFITTEVEPAAAWVLAGDGIATRKYDGTCLRLDQDGQWWARREVKPGRAAPAGWVQVDHDEVTGKRMGWEPIENSPFRGAFRDVDDVPDGPGTYELVGPKVNGNPERMPGHALVPHGQFELDTGGRDYESLTTFLRAHDYEGIVWHHPDGRMAKLKKRDLPDP